jgi:hypothetical protein
MPAAEAAPKPADQLVGSCRSRCGATPEEGRSTSSGTVARWLVVVASYLALRQCVGVQAGEAGDLEEAGEG